ncbi:redoxin domain-containing protein [Halorubellus sp. JP-L1]|uniref:redoxin domain-containing protein n=1 Tax=Halorubellus sp. JP-L1 TaxID=2715753 RepID=UPI0014077057|nr:redoxin domain-containing protein [Halorubellus sp. JP-L1]NHN42829.1 redoxin domain-containing protein [Halorubellus sp. JP-L1]
MLHEGDTVPDVTAKVTAGDDGHETFSPADAVTDGPVMLAFFPLAFSSICTTQVEDVQENHLDQLRDLDANVYGVSVDSPYALSAFHEERDLEFPLVSDFNREIIEAFGIATDAVGLEDVAQRAVFVVDEDQRVAYANVLEDGTELPTMDPAIDAVERLQAAD